MDIKIVNKMPIILNRSLIIDGENKVTTVNFTLPKTDGELDLSTGTATVDYRIGLYENKAEESEDQVISKTVVGDNLNVAWKITSDAAVYGILSFTLSIILQDGAVWRAEEAQLPVSNAVNAEAQTPLNPNDWHAGASLSQPLRGLPNGIADDHINVTFTRNTAVYALTGSETFSGLTAIESLGYRAYVSIPGKKTVTGNVIGSAMSTHFKPSLNYTSEVNIMFESGGSVWLCWPASVGGTTAAFKAWLSAQYANNTPVRILYQLATPTTETLIFPEIQIGVNDHIWVDGNPIITIEYRAV